MDKNTMIIAEMMDEEADELKQRCIAYEQELTRLRDLLAIARHRIAELNDKLEQALEQYHRLLTQQHGRMD
jgi:hypothetical protein